MTSKSSLAIGFMAVDFVSGNYLRSFIVRRTQQSVSISAWMQSSRPLDFSQVQADFRLAGTYASGRLFKENGSPYTRFAVS